MRVLKVVRNRGVALGERLSPLARTGKTNFCMINNNYASTSHSFSSFWILYCENPEQSKNLSNLAVAIENECRLRLRDGGLRGLLQGQEAEIRQIACLNLLRNFLLGNRRLIDATSEGNESSISLELSKSVFAALRFSRLQLARRLSLEASRRVEFRESHGGECPHSSQHSFSALPQQVRQRLALASVRIAVDRRVLSESNALIADMIIAERLSVSKIAKRLQISRSSIYQQIRRIKKCLPEILEEMEFLTA